ncbi:MAG: 30S ribosomal protein S19e [Nitrososphaeria archaeon]|nr:30S ribosomal protein S19e [Nitrososphaeria archaeon]NIQ33440.1 30S ribosomal protein S19e [Nitrososphaeria archaeon]
MVHVKEVPADILINRLREYIKRNIQEVKPPKWSYYVKTGSGKSAPPDDREWWILRAASILRKIYLNQPIGTQRLRVYYGGKKDRGVRPEHQVDGGGSNIRKILQQLEDAKLVMKTKRGRSLTPRGRGLLDRLATDIRGKLNVSPWHEIYKPPIKEKKKEKEEEEGDSGEGQ